MNTELANCAERGHSLNMEGMTEKGPFADWQLSRFKQAIADGFPCGDVRHYHSVLPWLLLRPSTNRNKSPLNSTKLTNRPPEITVHRQDRRKLFVDKASADPTDAIGRALNLKPDTLTVVDQAAIGDCRA